MKNNIFSRVWQAFKKKSATFLGGSSFMSYNGSEDFYDSLNLNTFKDSLYLFIGVSMIRDSVSSIPLEMYRVKSTDGEVEEIFEDPYLDLFERPNDRQTQKEFWQLAVSYYLLAGEAFWYLEKANPQNPNEVPTAMVNMRPDHIEVLLTQDKRDIAGYDFIQDNGTKIRLPKEQVLHIKNIDPTNPLRGIGVIRPATQRIISEKEASRYQAQTFRNNGRPDIGVFVDGDVTDESSADARARWNKVYGGDDRSKIGFFGNAIKDIKNLNVSPKEMDGIESMNFLRDDILSALHIPKAMITSDDVNLANSKTARINYMKEAVLPVLDMFIDIMNNMLLNGIQEDKFFTYESPVQEDRELLLKEAVELKKAEIITINEARGILNYDDVEGGDIREAGGSNFIQQSMKNKKLKRLALIQLKKRPVMRQTILVKESLSDFYKQKGMFSVPRERNSVFYTKEMKELYIKAFNDNIDTKADVFKEVVDIYNNDFLGRIIKYMEDFGINASRFFNPSTEIVEAKKLFVPIMRKLYEKTGKESMDSIARGFSTKASEQFYTTDDVIRKLEQRAEFFIASMLNTDFEQMTVIIAKGIQDGMGVDEIGRKLRTYFSDMSVARAKTIARTETGRIVSQATEDSYRQSELVTGKEWMTAHDSKVRAEHQINDGVIVSTNDVFPNGEHYPGENTINCRCAIAPAI